MFAKSYGSNQFINRVKVILEGKYDNELVALQSDTVTLQNIKIQSLILLEVLEELRKMNQLQVQVIPEVTITPIVGSALDQFKSKSTDAQH